jgi:hypothetical protein
VFQPAGKRVELQLLHFEGKWLEVTSEALEYCMGGWMVLMLTFNTSTQITIPGLLHMTARD